MKYLIGVVLLVVVLWATNPSEIQHQSKVREFTLDYVARLNAPFLASRNADSLATGHKIQQAFTGAFLDREITESVRSKNDFLFSFTEIKGKIAGIGILGKVYLFESYTSAVKL